jgi:hypothetical protein
MKWILNISFAMLLIFPAKSQTGTTYLEKQDFLIGEQVHLTYHFTMTEKGEVKWEPFKGVIPVQSKNPKNSKDSKKVTNIDIVDAFVDTILFIKGKKEWFGTCVLTAWDSGHFVIPRTSLLFANKTITFPETFFKVRLSKKIEGKDIYDIDENFEKISDEPFSFGHFFSKYWYVLLFIVLLIMSIFLYFKFKKGNQDSVEMKQLSLEEQIVLAIEELERNKWWAVGKLKEHYVQLSFIMRSYLSKRYSIHLLEKTTHETELLLTQKGVEKGIIENIILILSQSDFVKFAKSEPEEITAVRLSALAKKIVQETTIMATKNA